ncbi:MAG: uroporphyrinogen-III C-methyltransferase, partial [Proteobacteria bacterium]|nr:uroporphyrinogen-III C-methyltransferase [Pseudomonadota bacterium]MBL4899472.1 uroporphyrinogen-III C-methyltransferase [Colwellia sp.]
MTDKKTPLASEPVKKSGNKAPEPVKKSDSKAPVNNSKNTKPSTKEAAKTSQNNISKLALVAIVIALGSTAGLYFWQLQQSQLLTIKLSEQIDSKNTATFNQYQAQIKQVMIEQQKSFTSQLQQVTSKVNDSNQEKISELNTTVSRLERTIKQRQPSDWLLHETEYLIRIAARTLWLEHDTTASIGLLKDADARLADLNDPTFLPVRELVHQDIKSLELMPILQTDEVVLTLMAMNTQIAMLPLAMVDVGAKTDDTSDELSHDINDWQTNLAKTWERFLNDFIRVRQRTGLIKPLISPKQQQHLKQNLNLKIQLALWAASERKDDIYQKSLIEIQQWITEFFDLEDSANQHFLQALANLKIQRVSYDYPSDLTSLTAIRSVLRDRSYKRSSLPNQQDTAEATTSEQQPDAAA